MSYQDFLDWKATPVTKQVFVQLQERMNSLKDNIVAQAQFGNEVRMAYMAGHIDAIKDFLLMDFEDATNGD